MGTRKRTRVEAEMEEVSDEPTLLHRLRSTWEFASLMQYIYIFGKAVKIDDDIDVEELESECLKPTHSERLTDIGIALLKYVSSHKPLNHENFEEYARRQYMSRAPQRNPFGAGEAPYKFSELNVFTKLRILHQLSTWTFHNPDRIRERMQERDSEQTQWRIEPLGWDCDDRSYVLLDDDRLYRRTDPPVEPAQPKSAKGKAKSRRAKPTRASKRRKIDKAAEDSDDENNEVSWNKNSLTEDDGFGGVRWECLAVTLADYEVIISAFRRTRDPNEKALHDRLLKDVMPIIQKKAEEQERKALRKMKELETLNKLASAKRSSRIAGKMEKRREDEEAAEMERKRLADLAMARKEEEKRRKMEDARESRMMTREQRVKEREVKRILHEEELKRLEKESNNIDSIEGRLSERHLKSEMKRRKEELEKLQQEEDWIFDCAVCGVYGENLDDGTHSIACDKCSVWQHSACHGIAQEQAEKDDFHFICGDCKRKIEEASRPKVPPLKLRFSPSNSPNSRSEKKTTYVNGLANGDGQHTKGVANSQPINNSQLTSALTLESVQINATPSEAKIKASLPLLNGSGANLPSSVPNPRVVKGHVQLSPVKRSPLANEGISEQTAQSIYRLSPPRPLSNGTSRPISPTRKVPSPKMSGSQRAYEHNHRPASSQATSDVPNGQILGAHTPPNIIQNQHFSTPIKQDFPINSAAPNPPTRSSSAFVTPNTNRNFSQTPFKQALTPSQSFHSPATYPQNADPGLSPEKHDSPRTARVHGAAEVPVLPPIASLSPSSKPQILTPPVKKLSPDRVVSIYRHDDAGP